MLAYFFTSDTASTLLFPLLQSEYFSKLQVDKLVSTGPKVDMDKSKHRNRTSHRG